MIAVCACCVAVVLRSHRARMAPAHLRRSPEPARLQCGLRHGTTPPHVQTGRREDDDDASPAAEAGATSPGWWGRTRALLRHSRSRRRVVLGGGGAGSLQRSPRPRTRVPAAAQDPVRARRACSNARHRRPRDRQLAGAPAPQEGHGAAPAEALQASCKPSSMDYKFLQQKSSISLL